MPDANCPTDDLDCLPAGSNAVEPCSPCFEPTKESFLEAQAAIARQLCAVANQVKAWNQRLDKFRNRMNRLEDTINHLPSADDADLVNSCSNLSDLPEDGAESILACGAGSQVGLLPTEEGCSDIVGLDAKWKVVPHGLRFVPISTGPQLLTTSWATANFTALNEYDEAAEVGCEVWGLCDYQDFLTAVTSVTSGTSTATVNGVAAGAQYFTSGNDAAISGIVMFPMTDKRITLAVANSYAGSITHTSSFLRLWGYFV